MGGARLGARSVEGERLQFVVQVPEQRLSLRGPFLAAHAVSDRSSEEEPMPLRCSRKHKPSSPAGRKAARFRPRLEPLEERTLPATINWIAGSGNFDDGTNWS